MAPSSKRNNSQYTRTLEKARKDLTEYELELIVLTRQRDDARLIVESLEAYLGIKKEAPKDLQPVEPK